MNNYKFIKNQDIIKNNIKNIKQIFKISDQINNCQKKNSNELYKKFENERNIYLNYITNYFENSKSHKKYITIKHNLNINYIKDIKNSNTIQDKLFIEKKYKNLKKKNLKEYYKKINNKKFKKLENNFVNSKFKKELNKYAFDKCIKIYKKEIINYKNLYKNNKKVLNEINKYNLDNLKYNDYLKIIKIIKNNNLFLIS